MKHERSPTVQRAAWDRLWRILLAPPTDDELARFWKSPGTEADRTTAKPGEDGHRDLYRGSA